MTKTGGRRPTLSDIARRVGTSVPTVSKVLHGRADVSDELRSRIMAAIADTGYRRGSSEAPAPSLGLPPLIDLVLSAVEGTWANRALSGVERAAVQAGVDLVVSVARQPDDGWLARLLARNLRGAVLALVDTTPAQLATLTASKIPFVLLDPVTQPPEGVASVGAANWAGARMAAEHLMALGHTSFAVLAGKRDHLYSQARVDGFRSALTQHGLPARSLRILHADWQRSRAAHLTTELLSGTEPPTAIFACSDTMALGVYESARALGLRIPEDLSVVGFDDLPESRWVSPALTTIHQPIAAMGEAALRLMLRMREQPGSPVQREELATTLIGGASTATPRRNGGRSR
ncbi:MAG: LacI family DNA-binding transcriptional regulator [Frondihabitans sp.]|nr:LacI family DNA-binding transcriptional regulator [Frondihabitans sp.]